MGDEQRWQLAVAATRITYAQLSSADRECLDQIMAGIMALKQEMLELTLSAGSAQACRQCGGACCSNGKFHLSVLDMLAFFFSVAEIPSPDFAKQPFCPYGGLSGCLMPAGLRPVTCVIFNCEQVLAQMTDARRDRLDECETGIRKKVGQAETLLGFRAGRPLLLSVDMN